MKLKHIHFIINPASAKAEPVLSLIYKALKNTKVDWDVSLTKKKLDAGMIAKKLIGRTDLVAVYGGDGCVTSVAAALQGSKTPLAIIPGGTANVMAKELGVPLDTAEALAVLLAGNHKQKRVDMGLVNGEPFLLRVNLGIMAAMVLEAGRELKNSIGQLAYGVSTLKTVAEAEPVIYGLKIDGRKLAVSGVALTVTNSGHLGIADLALQPGISVTDGWLDVLLMKDNDVLSVLKVAGSALLQNKSETLEHWRAKKVVIALDKPYAFICDDAKRKAKKLKIEIVPKSLNVLVPC
jgi:YegS/Rv2252/BmrU family lipid kinase